MGLSQVTDVHVFSHFIVRGDCARRRDKRMQISLFTSSRIATHSVILKLTTTATTMTRQLQSQPMDDTPGKGYPRRQRRSWQSPRMDNMPGGKDRRMGELRTGSDYDGNELTTILPGSSQTTGTRRTGALAPRMIAGSRHSHAWVRRFYHDETNQ